MEVTKNTENVSFKFQRNCEEILKKSGEYLVQIFRHSKTKFRDIFVSIFGKTYEKLFEKQEIIMRKFWNNQEKL